MHINCVVTLIPIQERLTSKSISCLIVSIKVVCTGYTGLLGRIPNCTEQLISKWIASFVKQNWTAVPYFTSLSWILKLPQISIFQNSTRSNSDIETSRAHKFNQRYEVNLSVTGGTTQNLAAVVTRLDIFPNLFLLFKKMFNLACCS